MHPALLHNLQVGTILGRNVKGVQLAVKAVAEPTDNFRNFGVDLTQQRQIPHLHSLRHDGVVGVIEHRRGDVGRLVEGQAPFQQQAHQFRYGDDGVGVVELNGHRTREQRKILAAGGLVPPQDVLHRRRGEEILLAQAQKFARLRGIVGVQHAGEIFRAVSLLQGAVVLLVVEQGKVEGCHGLCLPQPQVGHVAAAVADNRHIVGHSPHRTVRKGNGDRLLLAAHRPGVAVVGPVVRLLDLKPLGKALTEQTEAIADTVAVQRQTAGGGGVQIAGRQPTQTAVTQGGVLNFFQAVGVDARLHQRGGGLVQQPAAQQIVMDQPPH